ncbi:hypothetical protein ILUMI_05864, partial [Ignelater luminosus]
IALHIISINAQLPPRLNIPGAVLLQPSRPGPRPQRPHHGPSDAPVPRLRKPIPNALPISIPIREEAEEDDRPSILDEEIARPERPIPVLRQDLRESPPPRPILRQDYEEENIPIIRQPPPQPIRQVPQARQHSPPPQPVRQQKARVATNPRPQQQFLEDEDGRRVRNRRPPVQIIRKYRTDNEDGSITWGFENEDGTFKEETIGADCIIRGKYGYIDPEGTRREYNYEAGNKCDHPEEEYQQEELPPQQLIPNNRPLKKQYSVPIKV